MLILSFIGLNIDMNVYISIIFSPTDQLWGIPVVLYFVWTVVLLVSSLIVVSCLQRETKKFHKRVSKTQEDSRGDLVTDVR